MKGKNVLLFGILILLILGSGCMGPSSNDLRHENIRDLLNTEAYTLKSIQELKGDSIYPKAIIYKVQWIENYTIQKRTVVATTETAFFIEYP